MQSLRSLIASPSALFAFEAAGRHMSFTRAAAELKVSQAAVSYSVKQLEQTLGLTLFVRHHKRIALTEAGERFFHDVSIGLAHIRRSAEAIGRERLAGHVTLSASTAFAGHWMLPRLARFRGDLPDIDLRLQTTDKDVDLAVEGITLGIRQGLGDWTDYDRALLASEEVYPICSPGYRAGVELTSSADLPRHKLIHLDEPFRPAVTWANWFQGQGIAYRDSGDGLRLNDYALVLQAVLEGEGVALGWHHLSAHQIDRGLLLKLVDGVHRTDSGFYVVWPKGAVLSAQAVRVRDWLIAQAA